MEWSKPSVNILLLVSSLFIAKCCIAKQIENDSRWSKYNFKQFEEKGQHREITKRGMSSVFERGERTSVLNAEEEQLKIDTDKHKNDQLNRNDLDVVNKISEQQKPSHEKTLRLVVLSRNLFKVVSGNGLEIGNAKRRVYKNVAAVHRIAKRHAHKTEPTQPSVLLQTKHPSTPTVSSPAASTSTTSQPRSTPPLVVQPQALSPPDSAILSQLLTMSQSSTLSSLIVPAEEATSSPPPLAQTQAPLKPGDAFPPSSLPHFRYSLLQFSFLLKSERQLHQHQ